MSTSAATSPSRESLEALYARFNHRECVHPDPIEFLYDYEDAGDREVVGLVAASLAYGRVAQILRSVGEALARMGARPSVGGESSAYKCARPTVGLREASREGLSRAFAGFRHRFTTGEEMAALLWGVRGLIGRHGSLNAAFVAHLRPGEAMVVPALGPFAAELRDAAEGLDGHLLPCPSRGSACKRLNLFLRWMVRRDNVDPGGWVGVRTSQLIVPLDTHMHRICRELGLTRRSQADMEAAVEATDAFRAFAPDDPVRYDFAISHLGMRREEARGFLFAPGARSR